MEAGAWYRRNIYGYVTGGCKNDVEAGQNEEDVREKLVKRVGYVPDYRGFYGQVKERQSGGGTYNLL